MERISRVYGGVKCPRCDNTRLHKLIDGGSYKCTTCDIVFHPCANIGQKARGTRYGSPGPELCAYCQGRRLTWVVRQEVSDK